MDIVSTELVIARLGGLEKLVLRRLAQRTATTKVIVLGVLAFVTHSTLVGIVPFNNAPILVLELEHVLT